jgi:hypothetical protein
VLIDILIWLSAEGRTLWRCEAFHRLPTSHRQVPSIFLPQQKTALGVLTGPAPTLYTIISLLYTIADSSRRSPPAKADEHECEHNLNKIPKSLAFALYTLLMKSLRGLVEAKH